MAAQVGPRDRTKDAGLLTRHADEFAPRANSLSRPVSLFNERHGMAHLACHLDTAYEDECQPGPSAATVK